MQDKSKVTNVTLIGFLSIALLFSADQTNRDWDLIDALIGYVDAKTVQVQRGE